MDQVGRLMLLARDGDRDAFAEIVTGCAEPVRRFVEQLHPGHDIDDIVQDTFIRLWTALPRFRGDSSGLTYVFAIARRAAVDEVRRAHRRTRTARSLHLIDRHSDIGEVHAMEALVAGLPDARREAFVLTQILGLSYEEAAAIVEVPVGTIRSRVARARDDLSADLRQDAANS